MTAPISSTTAARAIARMRRHTLRVIESFEARGNLCTEELRRLAELREEYAALRMATDLIEVTK